MKKKTSPHRERNPGPEGAAQSWLFQCPPGLSSTFKRELTYVSAIERRQNLFIKLQRNHDLIFANKLKSEDGVGRLRIAEMILRCPIFGRYKVSQRQLQVLTEELKKIGPRRLVVSSTGRHFQRQDLGRWLERELHERGYEFDDELEDEVWLITIDESYYFGIPVHKARDTEGRDTREEERPGSLPPTIAAALAFTLGPKNTDVLLDPVCGSGTLLSEFHAYAPEARLIGIDIDSKAVAIAKKNLPVAGQIKIIQGDSRKSGLPSGEITAVIANLPFGVQYGKKEDNPRLYKEIMEECIRLRHPENFRALFFTSDVASLKKAAESIPGAALEEALRVKVRGEPAYAFRLLLK
jgi:predicted RNA methylase